MQLARCLRKLSASASAVGWNGLSGKNVTIVGAPLALGQPHAGTSHAPSFLRTHVDDVAASASAAASGGANTLCRRIADLGLGWSASDIGDIPQPALTPSVPSFSPAATRAHGVATACASLADVITPRASRGDFILTLGGDHSVAMGSVAGILAARPDTGVVWVDAHADINDFATSRSANVHGMPLSFLTRTFVRPRSQGREWDAVYAAYDWLYRIPPLPTPSLVYIGLRDIDAGERDAIARARIKSFTMTDVDRLGIGKVMELALHHLGSTAPASAAGGGVNTVLSSVAGSSVRARSRGRISRPLHLSFDIDACDPSIAPCTGTRVEGGLNYREAHYVCEALAATGALASMDMVEVNPTLHQVQGAAARGCTPEGAHATVRLALGLIDSALGKTILHPSM